MIDKSFIEKIEALAVGARAPFFVLDRDAPDAVWVRKGDGGFDRVLLAPRPRTWKFASPGALVAAIQKEDLESGTVLVGQGHVVCLLGEDRRERFVMPMSQTNQARTYTGMCGSRMSESPREMAALLRREWPQTPGTIIGLLRSAKFSMAASDEARVTTSSAALSAQVQRDAMFGPGVEFPEEFLIDVPLYGPSMQMRELSTVTLPFLMELDLEDKHVIVRGRQDDLDVAVAKVQESLAAWFTSALDGTVVVLSGSEA